MRSTISDTSTEFEPTLAERLSTEVAQAKSLLRDEPPAIACFGSARVPAGHPWYEAATAITRRLAEAGFAILSGGGPGLMEAFNKGACEGGGRSIGLNIRLPSEQSANSYVELGIDFNHFASRKVTFCHAAEAFVVFPGGVGTLDELFEVLTLIQTKKSPNVPVFLYDSAFWQPLMAWLDHTVCGAKLISPQDLGLMRLVDTPDDVVAALLAALQS